MSNLIRSIEQLAAEVGVSGPRKENAIQRALYKATTCGIVTTFTSSSVTVMGYAEGADAECEQHTLTYPFEAQAFWDAVEEADSEGCDLYDAWNVDDEVWA